MASPLPPDCEQLLISGYVLGNLSPAEAALFAEILADNPEIAQQVAQMQEALELAYLPSEATPPQGLRGRILAANAQTSESISVASEQNLPQFPRKLVLGAMVVSVILGLGFSNYYLWQKLRIVQQIETPANRELVYSLEGNELAPEAKAKVVVNSTGLNATLQVNNLPPLPPGKVYVLWTVVAEDAPFTKDSKGAILTETFQVNNEGLFSGKVALPKVHRENKFVKFLAVTIEAESAPQNHLGSAIMATQEL